VVAEDLKLGDDIEYKIELDFPNLKVTVNGKSIEHSFDFFEKENGKFYFKAGNYCDTDNADHSDKGCLAVFSSLQTEHGSDDQELQALTADTEYCKSRYDPKNVADGGKSNIDLSKWELVYPGTKTKKIEKHPATFHNENFYSDDKGDLWFCTQEGGGHTSKTKDPRSEMNEMGFDAPLSKWKGRSQTAKLKVLSVSSWGGPVIGQIHSNTCGHNDCNAALKLRFDPPKISHKGYQVTAYMASDLKGKSTRKVVAEDLKLGDDIEYKIELDFPNLKVTVNGKSIEHSYDFYEKEDGKFYFKAGNYCDTDNADHSDKGCLVVFSSLQTDHGSDYQELKHTDALLV
jgi:hypothetical protein